MGLPWLIHGQRFSPEIHIVPEDDKKPHSEFEDECWCTPRVDMVYGRPIVTHNSADLREFDEGWERFMRSQEPPTTGEVVDVRYL